MYVKAMKTKDKLLKEGKYAKNSMQNRWKEACDYKKAVNLKRKYNKEDYVDKLVKKAL